MRHSYAVGTIVALLGLGDPAQAIGDKFAITPAEHAACEGDAERLCYASYPDEDKLLICMKSSFGTLSQQCRIAMKAGLKQRHMPL